MKSKGKVSIIVALCLLFAAHASAGLLPVQELGELLYFDKHLSLYGNQACASCHHPSAGYADPLNAELPYDYPVSLGSDISLNGGRNAPTSSYAAFLPIFGWTMEFSGGQFWDGRADTLKDQAKGPFLNPVEMAMPNEAAVIAALQDPNNKRASDYQRLFLHVFNIDLQTLDTSSNSSAVLAAYDKAAEAIGEYEKTFKLTPFTSKYDYYLAGKTPLNSAELRGLAIFEDPQAGNCASCHPSQAQNLPDGKIVPPLFTNFGYANLGIAKSTDPLLSSFPIDYGLGERTNLDSYNPDLTPVPMPKGETMVQVFPSEAGKFRVSSLRNIHRTAPYSHNGSFGSLTEMVGFLNTRDVPVAGWPEPEVDFNVTDAIGDLALSPQQEADLIVFLETLYDGYGNQTPSSFVLPPMTEF